MQLQQRLLKRTRLAPAPASDVWVEGFGLKPFGNFFTFASGLQA